MAYWPTSQCHMYHHCAQIYFVTSHLNLEALEIANLFLLLGKKDKRHLQLNKVVLGNDLGVCIKYNVEF